MRIRICNCGAPLGLVFEFWRGEILSFRAIQKVSGSMDFDVKLLGDPNLRKIFPVCISNNAHRTGYRWNEWPDCKPDLEPCSAGEEVAARCKEYNKENQSGEDK